MNTRSRRRWVLPVYLVLLAAWSVAIVVSFTAFGGPQGPVAWLQMSVVFLGLVVGIVAELMARREGR